MRLLGEVHTTPIKMEILIENYEEILERILDQLPKEFLTKVSIEFSVEFLENLKRKSWIKFWLIYLQNLKFSHAIYGFNQQFTIDSSLFQSANPSTQFGLKLFKIAAKNTKFRKKILQLFQDFYRKFSKMFPKIPKTNSAGTAMDRVLKFL